MAASGEQYEGENLIRIRSLCIGVMVFPRSIDVKTSSVPTAYVVACRCPLPI